MTTGIEPRRLLVRIALASCGAVLSIAASVGMLMPPAAHAKPLSSVSTARPTKRLPTKVLPFSECTELSPAGYPQQVGAEFTHARPFSVASISAFDPGPPPELGSAQALRDLREVHDVGSLRSGTRSAEQTAAAIFWNSFDDPDQMAQLRDAAHARSLDALDAARWLALRSLAAFDTRIAILTFKHRYNYWRPYTAMRHTATPVPLRDTQWQPLLRTHPHQDYPSAAGALMGAFVVGLEAASARGPLSMFDSLTGQTREWSSPAAMGQELLDARVWAGVHLRSAKTAGYRMGRDTARAVFERELRPL